MLPKRSAYVKSYDRETNWIYFLIENDEIFHHLQHTLKKYNDIWNKVGNGIRKEFDCKVIYNKTFLKTKIKSYGNDATGFHTRKIPKQVLILFLKRIKAIICKCF